MRAANDVRFWHKTDILIASADVRFRGNSGHCSDTVECPLLTQSRRQRVQKERGRPRWTASGTPNPHSPRNGLTAGQSSGLNAVQARATTMYAMSPQSRDKRTYPNECCPMSTNRPTRFLRCLRYLLSPATLYPGARFEAKTGGDNDGRTP